MPLRPIITEGTAANCRQKEALIDGFLPQNLLSDRGYDSNDIIDLACKRNIVLVIPPKKNRIIQRDYDKHLYNLSYG